MKITFLFLILSITPLFSQNGFNVIRKAEKKIVKGNYDKAMKLLNKAESMSFGFCGNAYWEAYEIIANNRIKIYTAQGQSLKAANELNNRSFLFDYPGNTDSLKMVFFLKSIDKQTIKNQLDSAISIIPKIDQEFFYSEFNLQVCFSEKPFALSFKTMRLIRRETYIETEQNKDFTELERFKSAIKNQAFYQLLL